MDDGNQNQDLLNAQPMAPVSQQLVESPEASPQVLNFVSNDPLETPKSKSPLMVIVLLVLLVGAGVFYISNRQASSFSAFPTSSSVPANWSSIDTKVGTMKYPSDEVKFAKTSVSGNGALIAYTNGRSLSLLDGSSSLEEDEKKNLEGIIKRMDSTQSIKGYSWRVYEKLWTYQTAGSPKQYSASAYTNVGGSLYHLLYQQGEADALAGGSPLTETTLEEARSTFATILAGVEFQ